MRDPSPYKTIAVASTFSPRFKQVLAEAKRIRSRFSADLHLIYVGERDEDIAKKFNDALGQVELPPDLKIHYEKGNPAEAILGALARENIDVVVAGALEKEVVLHPFLGNVARRLVREAPCSVMLFITPAAKPRPLRRIVFVADYSDAKLEALKKTLPFAAAESCERLYVIRIITTFDQARASIRASARSRAKPTADEDEEEALEKFVLSAGATEVPIETRCIRGNTGLAASDFVQSVKADLLVVPLQKNTGDTHLPSNIAWVTDVIPCNLWVIR
ncbi:MAG TPA: universal stress protein [Candidatus Udaeobacter sp.]|jgi:nucleotide-binding universal stress UspA family protein|nr:universal stress protein [Candidatus Udaeobacter sp.]